MAKNFRLVARLLATRKELVKLVCKATVLSTEMAEKVYKIVKAYFDHDLPLSSTSKVELELMGSCEKDVDQDRQPFNIAYAAISAN